MRGGGEGILVRDELGNTPVFEAPVGQIASNDEGDFSLRQLLDGNLERVGLPIQRYEHGCVHTVGGSS